MTVLNPDGLGAVGLRPRTADTRLVPAARALWRVLDSRGRVIGHVRSTGSGSEERFIACRYSTRRRAFTDIGAFWTRSEAVECLRLSR